MSLKLAGREAMAKGEVSGYQLVVKPERPVSSLALVLPRNKTWVVRS